MIKVLVNGALGRMGSEVVKTVLEQEDMELVAAVDAFGADKMIPVKNGNQMAVATDLKAKLMVVKPDVVVDFTRPDVVMASLRTVLSAGVRAVVGTTGFSEADLAELDELAKANNTGMKIHSVRLPGYVASQEVIFGSQGETLRISNEPVNRECYMPGVMLGCRKMMDKVGLTYGLDKLL